MTKKAGQDWLADQQSAGRKGEYIVLDPEELEAVGRPVETDGAGRPEEVGVAEAEDAAVGRDQPVPAAVRRRLHADDRLDEENRTRLRALFAGLKDENAAYAMKCLCLPDPVSGTATVVDHVRLFPNHADIRWKYRVHEQILPAVRLLMPPG